MNTESDTFDISHLQVMRTSEKVAWAIACLSIFFGGSAYLAKVVGKPSVIEKYNVIYVDSATGASQQLMEVKQAPIAQRSALIQSSIVKYISERESYYLAGIDERINGVLSRSTGQARSTLHDTWSSAVSGEDYPPVKYGDKTTILVSVQSVNLPRDGEALVRFTKTKQGTSGRSEKRDFEAAISYEIDPSTEQTLESLWGNPIGFVVTNYNVSAENIGDF